MSQGRLHALAAALVAAACLAPAASSAQRVGAVVLPDTVTVGDVFEAAVVMELPPGWTAAAPDTLPVAGEVESAGTRLASVDTVAAGLRRLTIRWPLTAWRPGTHPLPSVTVTLVGAEGRPEGTRRVELPQVVVESVLPADTAGLEPRPPKDVRGPEHSVWTWVLGALLAAVVLALVVWAASRRRRRALDAPELPTVSPRERALAELGRIRALGLLEKGDLKAFYSLVTAAVRVYLEDTEPEWGVDLTTSELRARLDGGIEEGQRGELLDLLGTADRVKFARYPSSPGEAEAAWERARAWVGSQPVLAAAPEDEDGAEPAGETSSEGEGEAHP